MTQGFTFDAGHQAYTEAPEKFTNEVAFAL